MIFLFPLKPIEYHATNIEGHWRLEMYENRGSVFFSFSSLFEIILYRARLDRRRRRRIVAIEALLLFQKDKIPLPYINENAKYSIVTRTMYALNVLVL